MKPLGSRLAFLSLAAVASGACGGSNNMQNGGPDGGSVNGDTVEITADISADQTWTHDKVYVLKTNVFVRDATLTIEAGTIIQGDGNSSLVITNTAKIDAVGTAENPIVFTSAQPEGSRAAGDWGGVVLLGKAPINVSGGVDNIEGFPADTDGTQFGGDDSTHDCGTMSYVRIEFAGFELSPDNELNALTVGACGSQTDLDYLQLHRGLDDGVEFFGGTAAIRHLLVTQPADDGLDWDFGWSGDAQFIIVQQNSVVGNHGFEADNNVNDNDATPRAHPTIYNATLIGSDSNPGEAGKTQGGMMLRRGTAATLRNVVVSYFSDWAIDVADYSTVQQADGGELSMEHSYFYQNANDDNDGWPSGFDVDDGQEDDCQTPGSGCSGFDEHAFFTDASHNNTFGTDLMLGDPLNLEAPSFVPESGSPLLSGGDTPPAGFDTSATFIGAIGVDDWTSGWTAYPPN